MKIVNWPYGVRTLSTISVALAFIFSSCQNPKTLSTAASPTQKDVYAEKVNRELRQAFPTLPATSEMVRQTEEDRKYAATLGPEIIGAVARHYVNRSPAWKWVIKAARPVQGHVLLWIEFPDVDDGAAHLIYSVQAGAVVGTFFGGHLG